MKLHQETLRLEHVSLSKWNLNFFCKPGTDLEWFKYWKDYCENWLLSLGMKKENIR